MKEHTTIKIAGDRLNRTCNSLCASGIIDTSQKQSIKWFFGHARDKRWTYPQAAAVIDSTARIVHDLFDGVLSDYDAPTTMIDAYRNKIERPLYIETPTWNKIDEFAYAVRSMRKPGFLISASQRGKTEALMEVKRRDKTNSTLMVRCPAAPSLLAVYAEIARTLHIPYRSKDVINLRYRILEALDDVELLMFDELHQAFIGCNKNTTIRIVESLRGLFDQKALEGRKIGMIFCGTTVIDDEMSSNGKLHLNLILDQFRRRGILKLLLSPVPPMEDAHAVASHYGLPHPQGDALALVKHMLRDSGIGQYISYLQSAKIIADGDSEKLTWDHYLAAYDIIDDMSWKDPKANLITKRR